MINGHNFACTKICIKGKMLRMADFYNKTKCLDKLIIGLAQDRTDLKCNGCVIKLITGKLTVFFTAVWMVSCIFFFFANGL